MSSASTSALSALLSSLNNGSAGLDVTSAVASIITAESQPVNVWQNELTTLTSQTTEINQLESEASAVSNDLNAITGSTGALGAVQATSSNTAAVTATAAPGATAGSHSIQVTKLATTGSWYSDSLAANQTLSAGSFDITEGGTTTTIGTNDGESLSTLATEINSQGLGVTASVVSDTNGSRLSLVANASGSAADFSVSNESGLGFTQATQAQNATLTVDGVPVTSASNTVTGAVNGLTLTLQSVTTSPATVTVAANTTSISSAIGKFVTDYNTLVKDLNNQFTFSTSTGSEGILSSDSVARQMQMDLLGSTGFNFGSGSIKSLTDLGISVANDGTLSVNTDTLTNAVNNNLTDVTNFFQGTGSGASATQGFSGFLQNLMNNYTDPQDGSFTVDLKSMNSEAQDLQDEINSFELYLQTQQTLLTTEYNNANIALQQLPEQIKQTQALLGDNSDSSN